MPVIVCENTECEYISKRRTRFINSCNRQVLHYTCKADLINIVPVGTGDESIIDYLGYQPYECNKCVKGID